MIYLEYVSAAFSAAGFYWAGACVEREKPKGIKRAIIIAALAYLFWPVAFINGLISVQNQSR